MAHEQPELGLVSISSQIVPVAYSKAEVEGSVFIF
jgi:hypothetical protein